MEWSVTKAGESVWSFELVSANYSVNEQQKAALKGTKREINSDYIDWLNRSVFRCWNMSREISVRLPTKR